MGVYIYLGKEGGGNKGRERERQEIRESKIVEKRVGGVF